MNKERVFIEFFVLRTVFLGFVVAVNIIVIIRPQQQANHFVIYKIY